VAARKIAHRRNKLGVGIGGVGGGGISALGMSRRGGGGAALSAALIGAPHRLNITRTHLGGGSSSPQRSAKTRHGASA